MVRLVAERGQFQVGLHKLNILSQQAVVPELAEMQANMVVVAAVQVELQLAH
jgi:hypothetical protein